jgi:hypothetical protein
MTGTVLIVQRGRERLWRYLDAIVASYRSQPCLWVAEACWTKQGQHGRPGDS